MLPFSVQKWRAGRESSSHKHRMQVCFTTTSGGRLDTAVTAAIIMACVPWREYILSRARTQAGSLLLRPPTVHMPPASQGQPVPVANLL